MADQLGRSVGDMYAGALAPAALLVVLYAALVVLIALVLPRWVPALPPEARAFRESDRSSGHRSLLVLFLVSCVAAPSGLPRHASGDRPAVCTADR